MFAIYVPDPSAHDFRLLIAFNIHGRKAIVDLILLKRPRCEVNFSVSSCFHV